MMRISPGVCIVDHVSPLGCARCVPENWTEEEVARRAAATEEIWNRKQLGSPVITLREFDE